MLGKTVEREATVLLLRTHLNPFDVIYLMILE